MALDGRFTKGRRRSVLRWDSYNESTYFNSGTLCFRVNRNFIHAQLFENISHFIGRQEAQEVTVRLGEYDFSKSSASRKDFRVKKITIHRGYSWSDTNQANDIAVLLLITTVVFDQSIRPICLPSTQVVLERQGGYVAGKWSRNTQKMSLNNC